MDYGVSFDVKNNVVDQSINELEREFRIISMSTDSNMDLFLKIWCACSNDRDEQRFLGIMSHICYKYLEADSHAMEDIENLNVNKIRENRLKIIKQLYNPDIHEYNELLDEVGATMRVILKKVREIDSLNWRLMLIKLFSYILYVFNEHKQSNCTIDEYILDHVYMHSDVKKYRETYSCLDEYIIAMREPCRKIFKLINSDYNYETEIYTYIDYNLHGNAIDIKLYFHTNERTDVSIPLIFNTVQHPVDDRRKTILIMSNYKII